MEATVFIYFVTATVLFVSAVILINNRTRGSRSSKDPSGRGMLPPGSLGWPLIGESLNLLAAMKKGCPESFLKERVERYGDPRVFKTGMFGERTVVVCGKEGNKLVFSNENKLVNLWWPASVRGIFGTCILTCTGDDAKRMRKILLSFLDPDALSSYTATMDLITQSHISSLWHPGKELLVYPAIKLYTFELACRLFASIEDRDIITKLSKQFNVLLKGVISLPVYFPGTRYFQGVKAANASRRDLKIILRQRRLDLESKKASPSQDLLSHLLVTSDEQGKFLSEEEILNNILVLLFAGHDTSCSVISVLMKYLAELPHVYEQVLKEQREIAEEKLARGESLLKWEDVQKMKYSWQVVSEVMRIKSPVAGSFRVALTDFEYAGYTIPKGWKLYWSTSNTHKDLELYPDMDKFDPSRFEGTGPAPYSYVPFGGGARMCVGKEYARLEILIFLHNIVNKFRWEMIIPGEKIEYDPMAAPVNGLPIRLIPHSV